MPKSWEEELLACGCVLQGMDAQVRDCFPRSSRVVKRFQCHGELAFLGTRNIPDSN